MAGPVSRPSVLVTHTLPAAVLARLDAYADVVFAAPDASTPLQQLVPGRAALLTMVSDRIDRQVIEQGDALRVIANVGVGYNNIDVDAARERGIVVTNTPDVLSRATADLTWALLLGITRRLLKLKMDRYGIAADPGDETYSS